jgi:uncharacterized protein
MRIALFLFMIGALVLSGYVAITGFFLANSVAGLLTVGTIGSISGAGATPTDPFTLGYRGNPMQALSLPFQILPIETPLGPMEAWLVPADGSEAGRAVYVHGIAGAREDGYRYLTMLHEAGWSVLMISYRNDPGAPTAPEGRHGLGLLEWPDLEAALKHFSPGPDGPGLLVVADSMGAAILGQFLQQSELSKHVQAVALDSPALSLQAILDQIAEQGSNPLTGPMAWSASKILPRITGLPLDRAEVAEVFADFPGPMFLAHGSGDRLVPIGPSEALAAARGANVVSLWTKADHLGSYTENPDAYRAAFAAFLAGLTG